jgi:hypothetical protein
LPALSPEWLSRNWKRCSGSIRAPSQKDPKALEAAVAGMTPDQAIALRKQDQDFAVRAKELDLDFEKIAASDRDSARKREVDTKDWTPKVLAGLIVVGYLVVQWFLLTHVVAADMREIVMRSLGMLDAALGLVLGYYFGSSAGSKGKDDTIRALAS